MTGVQTCALPISAASAAASASASSPAPPPPPPPPSAAAAARGVFEWVDGTLVEALTRGEWVVVENVNFCAASVVDRLNPLLEPGGALLVSESGLDAASGAPRVARPHPAFRIFFTLDPALGDVSRALRNRCVEVALDDAGGAAAERGAAEEAAAAERLVAAVMASTPRPVVSDWWCSQ